MERVSLFVHFRRIIKSIKDKNLSNNYRKFSILYFEQVDQNFLLYEFYLEIFCRLILILPIFLFEIDFKTGITFKKMSYCDNKNLLECKGYFRKKITYKFIKMTPTFAFMRVD